MPLNETLQAKLGNVIPGIQGVVYGFAVILVILLAPEGLFWRVRDRIFGGAVQHTLQGMGIVNPLGTAQALSPFGDRAGAASALVEIRSDLSYKPLQALAGPGTPDELAAQAEQILNSMPPR